MNKNVQPMLIILLFFNASKVTIQDGLLVKKTLKTDGIVQVKMSSMAELVKPVS